MTARAADSTDAGIVRLAEQAGADSAPVIRLADRLAVWFLPLTLVTAGAAWVTAAAGMEWPRHEADVARPGCDAGPDQHGVCTAGQAARVNLVVTAGLWHHSNV